MPQQIKWKCSVNKIYILVRASLQNLVKNFIKLAYFSVTFVEPNVQAAYRQVYLSTYLTNVCFGQTSTHQRILKKRCIKAIANKNKCIRSKLNHQIVSIYSAKNMIHDIVSTHHRTRSGIIYDNSSSSS